MKPIPAHSFAVGWAESTGFEPVPKLNDRGAIRGPVSVLANMPLLRSWIGWGLESFKFGARDVAAAGFFEVGV